MPDSSDSLVAVVGLGCVVPDAFSAQTYWTNTLAGHCALRDLSDAPRPWSAHHDPSGRDPDRAMTIRGAAVEGWTLDWRRFRIPPSDVATINPLALMTLAAGAEALDQVARIPSERTGVFIGATGLGWQPDAALRIRMEEILDAVSGALDHLPEERRARVTKDLHARLDARLGPVTEDAVVNGPASTAAGRLAMHYDLRGLHYAIDAGFASGLAALEVGVRSLRDGTLDAVVVGGASELLTPLELVAFSRIGGLARDHLRPFDAEADGTLLGEGVAMFVLQRLEDALRDGNRVHAVIRGIAGASDGHGRSLLAPLAAGQARVMQRAYVDADVDPVTIRYVECHATGTPVGDRSELEALTRVLGTGRGVRLGSGKAAVGHLRGGAGALGLLRAVLALAHGVIPRQIGFSRPGPGLESSEFVVPLENEPLEPRGGAPVARAAVSAFGFGGIGYHAVLEAFDPAHHRVAAASVVRPRNEPIAIVGMGGIFPGAEEVPAFWQALLDGYDATREVPKDRWDVDRYHDSDPAQAEKSYTRIGCFLDRFVEPAARWGIPPSSFETIDPSHLLCLAAAEQALADAGIDVDAWAERDRAAVMLGFLPYQGKKFLADVRVNLREVLLELERRLSEDGLSPAEIEAIRSEAERRFKTGLPPVTEDSLTGWLGSLNAGRIARMLDLHGPHYVVDAACASTHGAVHAAVQALRHRSADVVLTGAVWCDMQPEFFVGACRFNALSPTGSTPFDGAADGFIPGEGGGIFVLRRLEDALRDGQRIHAVIRGVAGATDGKGRSVLAPTVDGECAAMQQALAQAQVGAGDVGYVECHGTGTALGDAVEVEAITRAFGPNRQEPLRIGSVKSNIGHLNAAAGVPGIIKAALAVREGVIPPSLKVRNPNPRIDFRAGPVEVVRERVRWERPPGGLRRAGVSSFGVGGANMHIVLEEFRSANTGTAFVAPATSGMASPVPIARVAAADPMACVRALEELGRRYQREGVDAVAPACGEGPWRAAIVAADPQVLSMRLGLLRKTLERGGEPGYLRQQGVFLACDKAPLVATFPGQGPHYANMARELASALPEVKAKLEEADGLYRSLVGRSLLASFWTENPDQWEQVDEDIHCAVYAVNVALYGILEHRDIVASMLVGQSAGELAALVVAGSLSFADGLRAVHGRTRAVLDMPTQDPGCMVAVQANSESVVPLLEGLPGYGALAADNGPSACIVSVDAQARQPFSERLHAHGLEHSVLAVSHGYHSRLVADAMPAYRRVLAQLRFETPRIPILSTITGRSLDGMPPDQLVDHLTRQFVEPVRLRQAFELAWQSGGRLFVECGPKWSLTTFANAILEGREQWAQATIHPKVGEREQVARLLACLAVHGYEAGFGTPSSRSRFTRDATPADAASPDAKSNGSEAIARESLATIARITRGPDSPSQARLLEVLRQIRDLCNEALDDEVASQVERVAGGAEAWTPAGEDRRATEIPLPRAVGDGRSGHDGATLAVRLASAFAERTGYPEEMLEPDLDLEADLGIDTVKQVAVLGQLREDLRLARDPDFTLRDHPSIAAMATYLASRLEAAAASEDGPAERDEVRSPVTAPGLFERLRKKMAARTGYPEEMLEADLDLEADLGIDTVKQVAVLGELRQELGLPLDPGFELRKHPTLAALARHLEQRSHSAANDAAPPSSAEAPRSTTATTGPSDVRSTDPMDDIAALLRRAFAERTGYPEEMLEADLDLEADLGIDTVKQAAVLTQCRETLGLPPDPTFVMRDHSTIAALQAYFRARLEGMPVRVASTKRPSTPPPAGLHELRHVTYDAHAEGTMPSIEHPERTVVTDARLLEHALSITKPTAAASSLSLEALRLEEPAIVPGRGALELVLQGGRDERGRVARIVSGAGLHLAVVMSTRGLPDLAPLAPEVSRVFARGGGIANGEALARELGRPLQSADVWAHSPAYDEIVGRGVFRNATVERRMASLVDTALWHVVLLWTRHLGVAHRVGYVQELQLQLPASDEEVRFVVRLAPRRRGRARAEVRVYEASGRPLGCLKGVEGIGARTELDLARWRRLTRRLADPTLAMEESEW